MWQQFITDNILNQQKHVKKQLYKVAVIEDDPSIQLMYALKLKHEGYSVKTASNGEEGLQIIESFQPHLILLDLRMPVMSGDEMLRVLRQKPWGKTLKVIVLTNLSRNEAHIRLAPLRVRQYIVKANHTPKQVIEIIQEVLAS